MNFISQSREESFNSATATSASDSFDLQGAIDIRPGGGGRKNDTDTRRVTGCLLIHTPSAESVRGRSTYKLRVGRRNAGVTYRAGASPLVCPRGKTINYLITVPARNDSCEQGQCLQFMLCLFCFVYLVSLEYSPLITDEKTYCVGFFKCGSLHVQSAVE